MEDIKPVNGLAQFRDSRSAESREDPVALEKKGTPSDQKDMQRMGNSQELRRNFRFVSIYGYSMGRACHSFDFVYQLTSPTVLMATWDTVLT
jgi:hypothetical protein